MSTKKLNQRNSFLHTHPLRQKFTLAPGSIMRQSLPPLRSINIRCRTGLNHDAVGLIVCLASTDTSAPYSHAIIGHGEVTCANFGQKNGTWRQRKGTCLFNSCVPPVRMVHEEKSHAAHAAQFRRRGTGRAIGLQLSGAFDVRSGGSLRRRHRGERFVGEAYALVLVFDKSHERRGTCRWITGSIGGSVSWCFCWRFRLALQLEGLAPRQRS